ncbi:MAG: hypothetical protein JW768_16705 [Chitinispirillaceae bacterium]|nr:hypothetical protein [Chitinispirillaceae bacterium]
MRWQRGGQHKCRTLLLRQYCTIIVLACSVLWGDTSFDLQGRVPSSISQEFLRTHYDRIHAAVAPGITPDTTPVTIIYYSRNDRRRYGVRLPEWGGGGAIGRDTVIIPVDKSLPADMHIDRITLHELVHIALERAYGRIRLPRWLHEGLAMTLSGELSFEEQVALSRAVFTAHLLPLDSIEQVNRFDAYGATLAYSQSHAAVAFMIETYHMEGISALLRAVRQTGRFDSALYREFGLTQREYELLTRQYITERYRLLFLVGDSWLYWLPAALLVIAGFFAVRLRNRKRQRQMEEEEKTVPGSFSESAIPADPKRRTGDHDDEIEWCEEEPHQDRERAGDDR